MAANNAASRIQVPAATDLSRAFGGEENFATIMADFEPYDYWDADLGYTLASGRVSNWIGQISGTNDLAQATAGNQPLWNASGLGGKPDITWLSARADLLQDASIAAGIASGDRPCLFVIGNMDTLAATKVFTVITDSGAANFLIQETSGSVWKARMYLSDGIAQPVSVAADDTASHHFQARADSGGTILSVDGTESTDTEAGTIDWTPTDMRVPHTGLMPDMTVSFVGVTGQVPDAAALTAWNARVLARWGLS